MGGGKLCKQLGLDTQWVERRGRKYEAAGEEGQRILDRFDEKAPFIRQLSWKAQDAARAKGYIKTVLGRRCHFEKKQDGSGDYDFIYKALNKLIQGSSADQMKKAMVDADAAGLRLQIQVHDELDLTTETPEEGEYLAEIMRNAVPCNVPHKIDVERGTNWGNIK
jgi:DNA polymerase-1